MKRVISLILTLSIILSFPLIASASETGKVTVTAESTNIYESSNVNSDVLIVAKSGRTLTAIGSTKNFVKISFKRKNDDTVYEGYILKSDTDYDATDKASSSSKSENSSDNEKKRVKWKDWGITINSISTTDRIYEHVFSYTEQKILSSSTYSLGKKWEAGSGNKFLIINVSAKNNAKTKETFLGLFDTIDILYDKDYVYTPTVLMGWKGDIHYESANPLSSVNGSIVFKIPNELLGKQLALRFAGDSRANAERDGDVEYKFRLSETATSSTQNNNSSGNSITQKSDAKAAWDGVVGAFKSAFN